MSRRARHSGSELSWADAELRRMQKLAEEYVRLPEDEQRVRELRAHRNSMRKEVRALKDGFNRRGAALLVRRDRLAQRVRRAAALEAPLARIRTIGEALADCAKLATGADAEVLCELPELLLDLEARMLPPKEAEMLEAADWSYARPEPAMLSAAPQDGAEALDAYRLNRAAQELSLLRGFDTLLTPRLASGPAEYPHQIETARVVLRRMRGRALLCDEVGPGKTIEAGIIASE